MHSQAFMLSFTLRLNAALDGIVTHVVTKSTKQAHTALSAIYSEPFLKNHPLPLLFHHEMQKNTYHVS